MLIVWTRRSMYLKEHEEPRVWTQNRKVVFAEYCSAYYDRCGECHQLFHAICVSHSSNLVSSSPISILVTQSCTPYGFSPIGATSRSPQWDRLSYQFTDKQCNLRTVTVRRRHISQLRMPAIVIRGTLFCKHDFAVLCSLTNLVQTGLLALLFIFISIK